MALANDDLLIVQKPATKVHYKIQVADLTSDPLLDGTDVGQLLAWDGTAWSPAAVGTAVGQLLAWNGTDWVPATAPSEVGQMLEWSGTDWIPSSVIDGGTY